MQLERPPVLDYFTVLADATRCRLLLALSDRELTVSELCESLDLPQSTVSRHLKTLAAGSWIQTRPEGTRRLYRMDPDALDASASNVWHEAREQVTRTDAARQDARRVEVVIARRRARSREFFASEAGQWDRVREDLFGQSIQGSALLGLLDPAWCVADLGCGTGQVAAALAPFVRRLVAVDQSAAMLEAARQRLTSQDHVELMHAELERLPLEASSMDAVTLVLVLHHLPDPSTVLSEVARILRPGGRVLIVDLLPHDRHEYQQQMGHVWLGFTAEQVQDLLDTAGLGSTRVNRLASDTKARGPGLFTATARKN